MPDKKLFGVSKSETQPEPSKAETQPESPKIVIQRPRPLGNYLTHSLNDEGIIPEFETKKE